MSSTNETIEVKSGLAFEKVHSVELTPEVTRAIRALFQAKQSEENMLNMGFSGSTHPAENFQIRAKYSALTAELEKQRCPDTNSFADKVVAAASQKLGLEPTL